MITKRSLVTRIVVFSLWFHCALVQLVSAAEKKGVVSISVDYNRSLKDSIKAGAYDWVSESITEDNFPLSKGKQGKKEITFKFFHFDREIESKEVIKKMEEERYRPATLQELLAFGEAKPQSGKQFPIIALDSVWVDRDDYHRVARIWSLDIRRGLSLDYNRNNKRKWEKFYRFLAVQK